MVRILKREMRQQSLFQRYLIPTKDPSSHLMIFLPSAEKGDQDQHGFKERGQIYNFEEI